MTGYPRCDDHTARSWRRRQAVAARGNRLGLRLLPPVPAAHRTERQPQMALRNPHTGEKAPQSGIYKPTNGGKEIAVSKGDTLPPSKGQGTGYKLVRPTK